MEKKSRKKKMQRNSSYSSKIDLYEEYYRVTTSHSFGGWMKVE